MSNVPVERQSLDTPIHVLILQRLEIGKLDRNFWNRFRICTTLLHQHVVAGNKAGVGDVDGVMVNRLRTSVIRSWR